MRPLNSKQFVFDVTKRCSANKPEICSSVQFGATSQPNQIDSLKANGWQATSSNPVQNPPQMVWNEYGGVCTGGVAKVGADNLKNNEASATKEANDAEGFLKQMESRFPLLQWTPRYNVDGTPMETLIYHNRYLVTGDDGVNTVQDVYVSDQDLNQEGSTRVFSPQPNSISVEWAWVNLAHRHSEPLDLSLRMVSVPEINSINNYLDAQGAFGFGQSTIDIPSF